MAELLFLTSVAPHPRGSGVQQRTFHALRALADGYDIDLLVTGDNTELHLSVADYCRQGQQLSLKSWQDPGYLWRVGLWRTAGLGVPRILGWPEDWLGTTRQRLRKVKRMFAGRSYQVIHASRFASVPFAWALHQVRPAGMLQLDLDESEFRTRLRISRLMDLSGNSRESRRSAVGAQRCGDMEKIWLPRFQRIFVSSEIEAAKLREEKLGVDIRVVPNIIEVPEPFPPAKDRGAVFTLLFVGSFGYYPNCDAVRFFLAQVWPLIRRQASVEVSLVIVGKGMTEDFRASIRSHPGVRIVGEVPDLAPWYGDADAVIAPLRAGGGTRIKILEAFAHNRPVVATTIGAEGLAVRHEEHLLIADSGEAMSRSCLRLLEDETLGSELARNARQMVLDRYSFSVLRQRLLA